MGGLSGGGWAMGGMGIAGGSGAVLIAGTGVGAISITLDMLLSSSSSSQDNGSAEEGSQYMFCSTVTDHFSSQ